MIVQVWSDAVVEQVVCSLVDSLVAYQPRSSKDLVPLELPIWEHSVSSLFVLPLAHTDTSPATAFTTAGPGPGPAPGCCSAATLRQPTAQCCWGHHLSLRCHTHDADPPVSAHTDCTGEGGARSQGQQTTNKMGNFTAYCYWLLHVILNYICGSCSHPCVLNCSRTSWFFLVWFGFNIFVPHRWWVLICVLIFIELFI